MSTIFKIVFYCCSSKEDTSENIEVVEKNQGIKPANGAHSYEVIDIMIYNQQLGGENIKMKKPSCQ